MNMAYNARFLFIQKNQLIAIAILVILTCLHANAQNAGVKIPEQIKTVLNTDYPQWELAKLNEPWEIAYWKKRKVNPAFISGDFNGDKARDFALQIVHAVPSSPQKERVIMVFLQHGKSYDKIILEASLVDPALDITLHLIKKGSKGQEFDKEEGFIYPLDAIDVGYSDKASQSYIWKNEKFETITTGD